MLDGPRHQIPTRADIPIDGVVFQLEREKFEGKFGKLPIADWRLAIGNQPAQARGKI